MQECLQVYLILFFFTYLCSADASLIGLWHCHGWSTSPGSHQLWALTLARQFFPDLGGYDVLVQMDNTSVVVAYIITRVDYHQVCKL